MFKRLVRKVLLWVGLVPKSDVPAITPAPPRLPDGSEVDEVVRARYAIRLATSFPEWVDRRTETFEFVDAETIRRRMTVDFTLPKQAGIGPDAVVDVPLIILRKRTLRNFDLADGEGNPLAALTRRQNGRLALLGLAAALQGSWPEDQTALEELLEQIVMGYRTEDPSDPMDPVQIAERELQNGGRLHTALAVFDDDHKSILSSLIGELAKGFMLLAPMRCEPGKRRLIKFSYDAKHHHAPETETRPAVQGPMAKVKGAFVWLGRAAARFSSSFGLNGRREEIADIAVGWASSYHAEVIPPADTWIAEASLDVPPRPPIVDNHGPRAHVRIEDQTRDKVGKLSILFNAGREALILPLLVAAVAISATLAFVPSHADELDEQTLAAVLLAPFALAAYYVRSGEHRYVTKLLLGVRLMAFLPLALGIGVVAMLTLGFLDCADSSSDPMTIARLAARTSMAATAVLFFAWISPPITGLARRRVVRPIQRKAEHWGDLRRAGVLTVLFLAGPGMALAALVAVIYAIYDRVPI